MYIHTFLASKILFRFFLLLLGVMIMFWILLCYEHIIPLCYNINCSRHRRLRDSNINNNNKNKKQHMPDLLCSKKNTKIQQNGYSSFHVLALFVGCNNFMHVAMVGLVNLAHRLPCQPPLVIGPVAWPFYTCFSFVAIKYAMNLHQVKFIPKG